MGRTAVAASPALAAGAPLPRQQIPAAAAADWPCALSAKSGERAAGRSHGHAARWRNSTAYDRRHWGVRDPVRRSWWRPDLNATRLSPARFGTPAFLYRSGDVIHFDSEASQYYPQFYSPHQHSPLPILAIPDNRNGDRFDRARSVNPELSIVPFMLNFCVRRPGEHTPETAETARTTMTQSNVCWTLRTLFATCVGPYTNVPEGGEVKQDQQDWFTVELAAAEADKPLLVQCTTRSIRSTPTTAAAG